MSESERTAYKNPVCRGSWSLGSACGKCERCIETRPPMTPTVEQSDLRERVKRSICGADNDCAGVYCSGVCDSSYGALADAALEAAQVDAMRSRIEDLEKERGTIIQNKRVNDAIQTALERGELRITDDGWLAALGDDG